MAKRAPKTQTEVPGTERESIEEIDEAAIAYRETRDARMKLTKKEAETLATLAAVLEKHGIKDPKTYTYEDTDGEMRVVSASPTKIKIRVRKLKNKPANDDEAPEIEGDGG